MREKIPKKFEWIWWILKQLRKKMKIEKCVAKEGFFGKKRNNKNQRE